MKNFIQGESLRSLRKFSEAVEVHKKTVEIARWHLGNEHPLCALLLGNLAGTQRQAQDLDGAYVTIREALAIARKSPLRSQPAVLDGFLQLADGLRTIRKEFAEAEALYKEVEQYAAESDSDRQVYIDRARQGLLEIQQARNSTPPPNPSPKQP